MLSWLSEVHKNPASNDLDEFSQFVNTAVSNLCLPSTICTSTNIQEFITQLEPTNLSGVAAVVGGILSQDVLNALGGRELPIKNWLFFDGNTCILSNWAMTNFTGEGKIYALMGDTNGDAKS